MRHLTSIVAVNQDGVIGSGNSLPWRIRSDLRFFREQTLGNVVIMGRKTFDSLGGPLKDRLNVVVTHGFNMFVQTKSCLIAHSIEEAISISEMKKAKRQDVFVIGGATMYAQFAQYVDRYLITDVDKPVPDGDTFFPPEIIGDIDLWNFKPIFSGAANSEGDEASFKTFELRAKCAEKYSGRRDVAIQHYLTRSHMRKAKSIVSAALDEMRISA